MTRFYRLHNVPPSELWWCEDLVLHTPAPATRAELAKVAVARAEAAAALYTRFASADGLREETIKAIDDHVPLIRACREQPDGPPIALLALYPDRVQQHGARLVAAHGAAVATVLDGPPSSADSPVVKLLRKGEAEATSVRYIQAQIIRAVRNPAGAVHRVVVDLLRVVALSGDGGVGPIDVNARVAVHLAGPAELYEAVSARVGAAKTPASLMWHAVIADFALTVAGATPRLRLKIRHSAMWSQHRAWARATLAGTGRATAGAVGAAAAADAKPAHASQSVVLWRLFAKLAKRQVGRPFELEGGARCPLPRSPAELFGMQGLQQRDIKARLATVVAEREAELADVAAAALARAAFSVTPLSTVEHRLQTALPETTVLVCAACLTARPPGGVVVDVGGTGARNCTRCDTVEQLVRVRLNGCIIRDVAGVTRMCTDCGAVVHGAKAMPRIGVSTVCTTCAKKRVEARDKTPCEWCGKWRVGTVAIAVVDDTGTHSGPGFVRATGACPRHARALRAVFSAITRPHPLSVCAAAIACKTARKAPRRRRPPQRSRKSNNG